MARMICTKCFQEEYQVSVTDLIISVNGKQHLLQGIECEACPACGDVTFTHQQSLEIDKKRIALEFGSKPLLTPYQLKNLRRVLNLRLDEICDLLQIGRNTYGRWERGEVEITPSMNLLVHSLIEKMPDAAVNVLDSERQTAIEKANQYASQKQMSLGEYIRQVRAATRIMPDIISSFIGVQTAELVKIENNDLAPERIAPDVTARLAIYFNLTLDFLTVLLNETLKVFTMKTTVSSVHARSTCYDTKGSAIQASSVNKILEKLAQKKGVVKAQDQVSALYLAKVDAAMKQLRD